MTIDTSSPQDLVPPSLTPPPPAPGAQDGREEGCVFRPPTKMTQLTQVKEKSMCWVKDIKCMCVIPTYAPCD
jgi:hypothetical protein